MDSKSDRLMLTRDTWYAMTMLPGYGDGFSPYYSPARIDLVEPLKTGRSIITVHYFNAAYAEGLEFMANTFQVVSRCKSYLIASERNYDPERHYIFGLLQPAWIRRHMGDYAEGLLDDPQTSTELQAALNRRFGVSPPLPEEYRN